MEGGIGMEISGAFPQERYEELEALDCSPKTQRIASEIFDFPHPLGPTIAVTPLSKIISILSAKDLKPISSIFSKFKSVLLFL